MNDMTPTEYAAATGAAVRAELARRRKSQSDMAKVLSITPATARKRLSGESPLNVAELARIANWLQVPVSTLRPQNLAAQAVTG